MFCTNCGNETGENAVFCARCGVKVGSTQASAPGGERIAEKKLTRPAEGGWMAGVCAGFAQYFGIDVTLVRLLWLGSVILLGTGILAYIICWVVMPKEYSKWTGAEPRTL